MFIIALCIWIFCSLIVVSLLNGSLETEVVMTLRLEYRCCYEYDDWMKWKIGFIIGGPLTVLFFVCFAIYGRFS